MIRFKKFFGLVISKKPENGLDKKNINFHELVLPEEKIRKEGRNPKVPESRGSFVCLIYRRLRTSIFPSHTRSANQLVSLKVWWNHWVV